MTNTNIEKLLKQIGLKTPYEELTENKNKNIILDFLKSEKDYQQQHKVNRLLKRSGIKNIKTLNSFDWLFNPKIPKNEIITFSKSKWITKPANLVMIGDTGLGKSHIATSLCYEAILQGHTTTFITAFDLLSKIKNSINPASKIEYYSKIQILCIDELGYTFHKKEDTDVIFQVISKRTEILPTIISTNLIPKEWGTLFSGSAASAILDRLSYNGKFLIFEGDSYRSKYKK